ncbi:DUF3263 domain-containing protein [Tessaracoccus flavus]|uniref:Uncharacterized protein n=1 Tax=Tessaracoccus flavus TaxID=1610493 RepID=A0A1Q2CGR1_9ACTN|nr:DUF3263 domain-containing protein [Tessaracoccus flavus]AQP45294.1 hypothetical protein RPIT_11210 [Tessaracoccus flavus]SDY49892.1 Protein of unknown function [Tessaracoccus flavus]
MSQATTFAHGVELSARDAAVLDFEDGWYKSPVPKEQAIMERFQLTSTKYYQLLNALIDAPEALEYKPLLVKRLRRERSRRQQLRSARRLHA